MKHTCRSCGEALRTDDILGRCLLCRQSRAAMELRAKAFKASKAKPKRPKVNNFDPTRPDYDYRADHFNRSGWLLRWCTYFGLFDQGYRNNRSSQIALAKSKKSGRVGGGFRYITDARALGLSSAPKRKKAKK